MRRVTQCVPQSCRAAPPALSRLRILVDSISDNEYDADGNWIGKETDRNLSFDSKLMLAARGKL